MFCFFVTVCKLLEKNNSQKLKYIAQRTDKLYKWKIKQGKIKQDDKN